MRKLLFPHFDCFGKLNHFSPSCPFRPFFLFCLSCIFCILPFTSIFPQTCQNASVELSAVVESDPPRIILSWAPYGSATQHFIYRKLKNASSWGAVIESFSGEESQFVDSTVQKGISYEYHVLRDGGHFNGYGYINAGIEIPVVENRGVVILVVDSTFVDSLSVEIRRLTEDLEGDGWKVLPFYVSRTASVPSVKEGIVSRYNAAPSMTKAVFIIGHVPVPYSGEVNIDGHPEHTGAYPADVYYGDINGTWTDVAVNNVSAADPRNHNVPGDGKFDQAFMPSDVELAVGRVDFANMPAFAASELQLLRNYLNKDHEYRQKVFSPVHRAVVDDNFGYFGGEAFAASGWKNFGPLVGHANVIGDDYFNTMRDSSYLWAYGCGAGWYQGASGVGSTADFANSNLQGVFSMLFGSYFGDWDTQDNFLRAPLAQGRILTNAWSGRPHWQFHHMGLGEHIGYNVRLSQNNSGLYYSKFGSRVVHIAFMGDPTLRNDVVSPPSKVVVTKNGYHADISWSPSGEEVIGYHIYRKPDFALSYERVNADIITDTSYTDSCLVLQGVYKYMVRAIKLQQSPSGTYFNMSQGATGSVLHIGDPTVLADFDYSIQDNIVSFTNLTINATSYLWQFDDGESSTEENPVHTYAPGTYDVKLTAWNECAIDSVYMIGITIMGTSTIETADDKVFSVYPNPAAGKFSIDFNGSIGTDTGINIYSALGSLVFEKYNAGDITEIDLTEQPEGVYIILISLGNKQYSKKLILQR